MESSSRDRISFVLVGRSGVTEWELNMLLGLCTRIEKRGAKSL